MRPPEADEYPREPIPRQGRLARLRAQLSQRFGNTLPQLAILAGILIFAWLGERLARQFDVGLPLMALGAVVIALAFLLLWVVWQVLVWLFSGR